MTVHARGERWVLLCRRFDWMSDHLYETHSGCTALFRDENGEAMTRSNTSARVNCAVHDVLSIVYMNVVG